MDKWNHRITEVVRDILTPKNGDHVISCTLLISYFFLVPLLKGVWPPLLWRKYFLTSCFLLLVPSPFMLGSLCLCLSIPAHFGDRCRAQKALPLAFSSWGRINFPPSSSPLMSPAPLCQLRCWGTQKWTCFSKWCLISAKRKGRIISAAFQVQLAVIADSCSTLCWPPMSFPTKIPCWHLISACRAEWCCPGPDVVFTALVGLHGFSIRSFFFSLFLCLAALPSAVSDTHPLYCIVHTLAECAESSSRE